MSKCRGCSECEGSEHHWLDNPHMELIDALSGHPRLSALVCKHCDAVASECPACEGTGYLDEDDANGDPDDECQFCDGSGVIILSTLLDR